MELIQNKFGVGVRFTKSEQIDQYEKNIQDIQDNTRYILDNLDSFITYRVNWINYRDSDNKSKRAKARWQKSLNSKKSTKIIVNDSDIS